MKLPTLKGIGASLGLAKETAFQFLGVGARPSTLLETIKDPEKAFGDFVSGYQNRQIAYRQAKGGTGIKGLTSVPMMTAENIGMNLTVTAINIAKELAKMPFKVSLSLANITRPEAKISLPVLGDVTTYAKDFTTNKKELLDSGIDDKTATIASFLRVGGQGILDCAMMGQMIETGAKVVAAKGANSAQKIAAWKLVGEPNTPAELAENYDTLAHQFHPDMLGGDESAFKLINSANQILEKSGIPTSVDFAMAKAGVVAGKLTSPISKIMDMPHPSDIIPFKQLPEKAGYVSTEPYQPAYKPAFGLSIEEKNLKPITTTAITPKTEDPVQIVIDAIQGAKPIRALQETGYTEARGIKFGAAKAVGKTVTGESGFYAELRQLRGELPKVQFEAIRDKVGQGNVEKLFDIVAKSPALSYTETISARTGLAKLFGEYGGTVPTEGELALLEEVFPKEFTKSLIELQPWTDKMKKAGVQLLNIPRALMASFDFSFGGKQGLFLAARYPKEFGKAFLNQFKAFGSEKGYQTVNELIRTSPRFDLAKKSGLALTNVGGVIGKREESFASQWAEKIPLGIGKMVRASGRAYTAMANKLRIDVFSSLVNQAQSAGRELTPELTKAIAAFVNAGSGRSSLGMFERSAVNLNAIMFSPRWWASRLTLLNPVSYIKADPFVRKEMLKTLFSFAGMVLTFLGLAKLGGAEVSGDCTSSDFGKIKIGNTRIDITAGFQQQIRMACQLVIGKYTSATTGKTATLGEGYKPLTRWDIITRQFESKAAPIVSFIIDIMKGTTYVGEPVKLSTEIQQRLTPMVIQGLYDIAKDNPSLLPLGILGVFGLGIQTFQPKTQATPTSFPLKIKGMEMPSLKGIGK